MKHFHCHGYFGVLIWPHPYDKYTEYREILRIFLFTSKKNFINQNFLNSKRGMLSDCFFNTKKKIIHVRKKSQPLTWNETVFCPLNLRAWCWIELILASFWTQDDLSNIRDADTASDWISFILVTDLYFGHLSSKYSLLWNVYCFASQSVTDISLVSLELSNTAIVVTLRSYNYYPHYLHFIAKKTQV